MFAVSVRKCPNIRTEEELMTFWWNGVSEFPPGGHTRQKTSHERMWPLFPFQMLQQDQRHFLRWHSASNASRGAVPAGRPGDGAPGPGLAAVPRPRRPRAFCRPGGRRGAPARRAQRVLALAAFLLSGGEQWKLSSRQHWWARLVLAPPVLCSSPGWHRNSRC